MTSAVAALNTNAATETAAALGSDASRRGEEVAAARGCWSESGSSSHPAACGCAAGDVAIHGGGPAPAVAPGGAWVAVAAGTLRRSQPPHSPSRAAGAAI